MNTFIATFIILATVILIMSVGVIVAGRRIKGSCGGLSSFEGLEDACMTCEKPCEKKKAAYEKLKAEGKLPENTEDVEHKVEFKK